MSHQLSLLIITQRLAFLMWFLTFCFRFVLSKIFFLCTLPLVSQQLGGGLHSTILLYLSPTAEPGLLREAQGYSPGDITAITEASYCASKHIPKTLAAQLSLLLSAALHKPQLCTVVRSIYITFSQVQVTLVLYHARHYQHLLPRPVNSLSPSSSF